MAGFEHLTFHDLRHVAITRLLEKGFPHALAMKISGHKQMTTFLRYVNPTTESLVDLMRRSEAVN
jgi:integrase